MDIDAMEIVGAFVADSAKSMFSFMFSKIANHLSFRDNLKTLAKERIKLRSLKQSVKEDIKLAKREGKLPRMEVTDWINKVMRIELEVDLILEMSDRRASHLCSPSCNINYRLSTRVMEKIEEVKELLGYASSLSMMVARSPPIKPVERMPTSPIMGQSVALQTLQQILNLLEENGAERIAVWGMAGVGKTTLLRNLNNELEESQLRQPFDIVIWVSVSKELDLQKVQVQISKRLKLKMNVEDGIVRNARLIFERLKLENKFLLILDDVWEKIDLDAIGIPHGADHMGCKIILTTRSMDVCREMKTDQEFKLNVLNEDEAWLMFSQNVGNVIDSVSVRVRFLAREVAKELGGLPLAIKTVSTSMRGKTRIELWKNALCELHKAAPHINCMERDVFIPLKWSYDSLEGKIMKQCFLYCSLFPEDFSIKTSELIQCWIAEGLIDEQQSLEESSNKGIALIEKLMDSCMLEHGEQVGTVKMHDIVRDVAIWIASSAGEEAEFFIRTGIALCEIPEKMQKSLRRISLMNNKITKLPSHLVGCSELSTLFLRGSPIKKIPDGFFREVSALRVLNLSGSDITSLPPSLLELQELRALFLRDCSSIEKLPPVGAFVKLRVLDLCRTSITELPECMCQLYNLKELDLSYTHRLKKIQTGMVSGLSSLEVLDMSFSAYKWDAKGNLDKGRATLEELVDLAHLSSLCIRLDNVSCLVFKLAWLKRLKRFNIHITSLTGSCDAIYLPIEHDEKRVTLSGVDLMKRGLEGLLSITTSLDLDTCGGISGLCELAARRSMNGLVNLKSLTISGCHGITNLINGEDVQCKILPNLESLTLTSLRNLNTIVEGMVPRRGCLRKLKTIEVIDCPSLKNLISYALLCQLRDLEEIKVSDCTGMMSIFAAREMDDESLSKLKTLAITNMVELTSICMQTVRLTSLERIEVSNCPKLEKLDKLKWGDKVTLQQLFKYAASTQ